MPNETFDPLPAANMSFLTDAQTFWQQELQKTLGRFIGRPWVYSGGLHGTIGSMVSPLFTTEAFTEMGTRLTGDGAGGAVAIDYAAMGANATADLCWVIL